MHRLTIFEFDSVVADTGRREENTIPVSAFSWLKQRCLSIVSIVEEGNARWLRPAQRGGKEAVQVTNFVGVIRAPCGFQIEVLPKTGKVNSTGHAEARRLLIEMLHCLNGFRHIHIESAFLAAATMPLLEVFIREFLRAVESVVKRGLRSDYVTREGNLVALRGKLQMSQHIRQNLHRADRFFTAHDEFLTNRPENRLLHAALKAVLLLSTTQENQRLARELCFVFADVPASQQYKMDFERMRLERDMHYYADALAWARLELPRFGGHIIVIEEGAKDEQSTTEI